MPLVMVPACAKAADGAEPTQQRIKTKAAGSLARERVIQGPPLVIGRWVLARFRPFTTPAKVGVRRRKAGMVKAPLVSAKSVIPCGLIGG